MGALTRVIRVHSIVQVICYRCYETYVDFWEGSPLSVWGAWWGLGGGSARCGEYSSNSYFLIFYFLFFTFHRCNRCSSYTQHYFYLVAPIRLWSHKMAPLPEVSQTTTHSSCGTCTVSFIVIRMHVCTTYYLLSAVVTGCLFTVSIFVSASTLWARRDREKTDCLGSSLLINYSFSSSWSSSCERRTHCFISSTRKKKKNDIYLQQQWTSWPSFMAGSRAIDESSFCSCSFVFYY